MGRDARLEHDRDLLLDKIQDMEEQMAYLHEELIQANRLATLGVLAGMIAHECNNIMTPVMGYAQLAMQTPDDQRVVHKALTRVVDGTSKVSRIAATILGYLQTDEQMASSDINQVLDECISCLGADPDKLHVKIDRAVPPTLRVSIRPVCLQQVMLNLMLNAVEAIKEVEGGRIAITARDLDDDGVMIEIEDNGCGIPVQLIERVFNPLIRENLRPEPSGERGTGLGLTVCRHLVEAAGGSIAVKSKPGCGTTFKIKLCRG